MRVLTAEQMQKVDADTIARGVLVTTFCDSGVRKPNPKPFQRALDFFQVKPDEAIMVGDWPERDVKGAGQLGMVTVFARYGDTKDAKESGADHDIDDIFELVELWIG